LPNPINFGGLRISHSKKLKYTEARIGKNTIAEYRINAGEMKNAIVEPFLSILSINDHSIVVMMKKRGERNSPQK
jgi:hypothetical protein